jgi:hypothetical protein
MYLLNAFSANMLADFPTSVTFAEISAADARLVLMCIDADGDSWESAVGHADTASVFEAVLRDVVVPCNRVSVTLRNGDSAILGQYSGPRLPEGATELPDGAEIKWLLVRVG